MLHFQCSSQEATGEVFRALRNALQRFLLKMGHFMSSVCSVLHDVYVSVLKPMHLQSTLYFGNVLLYFKMIIYPL